MPTMMMSFVALLSTYALIALSVAEARLHASLFLLPIVLMCLLASRPRWSAPRTVVLAGLSLLGLVCVLGVGGWGPMTSLLVATECVATTLIGLSLVESVRSGTPQDLRDGGEYGPVSGEVAHALVSRELRRSRRTGSPLSLLVLKGMTELDPAERRALGDSLRAHGREFDTVFAASADELVILCVNTTRSGAREYVERMRTRARVPDFAVACFPDDAVTVQGLFDAVREPADGRTPRSVAAAGPIDPGHRRDSEAIS